MTLVALAENGAAPLVLSRVAASEECSENTLRDLLFALLGQAANRFVNSLRPRLERRNVGVAA